MSLVARVKSWFRVSSRRADFEREMQDEMRIHLELYQADLRRRGLSEEEARRRAFADFGSPAARQEECREAVGLRLFDELRGDIAYAVRLLRRSPAFTIVALLSLALGIGANTAIFSLIDTVLVKTLPVQDPQRLFFVDNSGGKSGGSSGPPYPCFERLRDHNRFLSGIAAFDATRSSRCRSTECRSGCAGSMPPGPTSTCSACARSTGACSHPPTMPSRDAVVRTARSLSSATLSGRAGSPGIRRCSERTFRSAPNG